MVAKGVSPRGTVSLQQAAQGWAAYEGRGYAVPEDVKAVAPLVLPHRITLRPGSDLDGADLIDKAGSSGPAALTDVPRTHRRAGSAPGRRIRAPGLATRCGLGGGLRPSAG
jgi:MoxR-like ATPase